MSALVNVYIKKETLVKILAVLEKKNENSINIDLSINDKSNDYGQNVSAYVSQTKEQREAKKDKFYIGNGKVFWTDGKIEIGKKIETHEAKPISESTTTDADDDGLPF